MMNHGGGYIHSRKYRREYEGVSVRIVSLVSISRLSLCGSVGHGGVESPVLPDHIPERTVAVRKG